MRHILFASLSLILPGMASGAPQCAVPTDGPFAQTIPASTSSIATDGGRALSPNEIAGRAALVRLSSAGATLLDLGTEHGLRSVFARNGASFQIFYLTPDGQAEIGGVMWDAAGQNITRRQVASIEGMMPTVTIGTAKAPAQAAPATSMLKIIAGTTFGTTGPKSAPRLWMIVDPMCSYSQKVMAQLKPYVEGGRVQLAVVPVSLLDYEDQGASTALAKIMVSLPSDNLVEAWASGTLVGAPDAKADEHLRDNLAAANAIRLRGTPTFLWQKADGSVGRSDGIPDNLETMIASVGG